MAIKLELELNEPDRFFNNLFGSSGATAGQTATLEHGLTLTNMTAGGQGISPSDVVTFVVDNYQNIAAGVAAAALYDIVKGAARTAIINGRKILKPGDIQEEIEKSVD